MGNSEASLRDPEDNLRPRDEAGVEVIVNPENIKTSSSQSVQNHAAAEVIILKLV